MNNLTRVALIFGGATPEHGVSCLTAAGVLAVIDQTKYEVVGIGISRSGRWFKVPLSVIANYKIVDGKLPEVSDSSEDVVWLRGTDGCQIAFNSENKLTGIKDIDVAFTLLHGPYGEDGTVQGLLEMMGCWDGQTPDESAFRISWYSSWPICSLRFA
ncbi:MAG: hypothetical protein CR979_01275 [Propionibacterium sp.]|nr:MAG: hypothetical protein CR979_01275 [Propionibacterium sp.]